MARRVAKKTRRKTAAKKPARRKAAAPVTLVVGSKVKEYVKGQGCKNSAEVLDAANAAMQAILDKACTRASANKRSTVRAQDF